MTTRCDEALKEVAAVTAALPPPGQAEEIESLKRGLTTSKDDQAALSEQLALIKTSLQEAVTNHSKELEEAAKSRAEEVTKLCSKHDEDVKAFATTKSEMTAKISDLEGEIATLKATIATQPTSPKTNGTVLPQSPGISESELQQMHQAHNLKLHDVQAENDRAMKALKEELDKTLCRVTELQQEVGRKDLEIQLLEQDQEEKEDFITKLQEDVKLLGSPQA